MKSHTTKIPMEVTDMLRDMGLKPSEDDRPPFWRRWSCRLLGPHQWVPVYLLDRDRGALVEDGIACTVCRKECA